MVIYWSSYRSDCGRSLASKQEVHPPLPASAARYCHFHSQMFQTRAFSSTDDSFGPVSPAR